MNTIYKPKGKALEYCELALNLYRGCPHKCKYCFNIYTRDLPCFPRKNIIEELEKYCLKNPGNGQEVLLCFTCDPFPVDLDQSLTYDALVILRNAGYKTNCLTKNPECAIIDASTGYMDKMGVTFTSIAYAKEWEPKAPSVDDRIRAILDEINIQFDFKIWVSLEPVLSMDVLEIVEQLSERVSFWKIGKLNHVNGPEEIDWRKFRTKIERLLPGGNFMFKKDTLPLTLPPHVEENNGLH